jgi:hypothetical protein
MANVGCGLTFDAGRAAADAPLESQAKHGQAEAQRSATFAQLSEWDRAQNAKNFIVTERK